ncbi:SPOSA6832_04304 [Sporobolomyces salmonicolor]|uniref:SPOSA6832_04304-mRNA-1:cds n=1 Tax=Sporidiobolus salmonicolor TaxID=5005 RepID=A0A0D6ERQ5_SPOSA|nr:SPOSA6832_04304 [Sporobolomyces salmonicolor]
MALLSFRRLGLLVLPLLAIVFGVVRPKLTLLGVFRTVVPHNNHDCAHVKGLEACEDAFVVNDAGLAYLVCSDQKTRQHWLPAILHINATGLPPVSTDYLAILDFSDNSYRRLRITGLPDEARGLYSHSIEIYRSPDEPDVLTVFLVSHRPPKNRPSSFQVGADSVVEILETTLGSDEVKWVKTVRHPAIRTPNNLVATGPRTFYVSNDHRYKVHWTRAYEVFKSVASDIAYCDASGIAKGPGDLLYQGSTLEGVVRVFEAQKDHSLVARDVVSVRSVCTLAFASQPCLTLSPSSTQLERPVDNVHVAEDGSIFVTTFPKIDEFRAASKDGGQSGKTSSVEIWRISNETRACVLLSLSLSLSLPSETATLRPVLMLPSVSTGNKYRKDLVFADLGDVVSASTSSAPYKNKLLLTGVYSSEVVVCDLK